MTNVERYRELLRKYAALDAHLARSPCDVASSVESDAVLVQLDELWARLTKEERRAVDPGWVFHTPREHAADATLRTARSFT